MGRPIKKSSFGDVAKEGYQLTIVADVGNGPENCHIISQRGTRKYKCRSVADETRVMDCFLVDGAAKITGPGMASMTANLSESADEHVRTLLQYTAKTFSGNVYGWDKDGSGDVVIGVLSDGGDGIDTNPAPVLSARAALAEIAIEPSTTFPCDLVVTDGGVGYADGTYTDVVVEGYTGDIAPEVEYVVIGGVVASATLTHIGSAANGEVLMFTVPLP